MVIPTLTKGPKLLRRLTMYSFFRRLLMPIGVLMLCSCGVSASRYIPTETIDSVVEFPRPSSTPNSHISTLTLQCSTYIETTWGTRVGQLGLCPASSEQIGGPYSPVLNARGDLFILDEVNQRILCYSGSNSPQVIPIPSSYILRDPCSYSTRGLSNLGTYEDRLFLRFPAFRGERLVEHVAVLSSEGQEEHLISLEAYYPKYPLAPVADAEGGVYLLFPTLSVLYFDANFRPEFMGIGADELLGSKGLAVGWDGNIYTYSASRNQLTNWGMDNSRFRYGGEPIRWMTDVISATQITSPTWKLLLGADAQGQLYFDIATREQGSAGHRVVRISPSGDEVAIATVPDGILDDGALPSFGLAPDGSLYGLSYGLAEPDPSVNPRIVRCVFDQEQTSELSP